MIRDPILLLVSLARDLGLTAADVHRAADLMAHEGLTLRQALAAVEQRTPTEPVAKPYPEGRAKLLDGLPAIPGLAAAVRGFGDDPLTEFTAAEVQKQYEPVRAQAAVREAGRRHAAPDADPRRLGTAARTRYYDAARSIGRALSGPAGCLAINPMDRLTYPKPIEPAWDQVLDDAQLRDYALVVLTECDDPEGDAVTFGLLRAGALRINELLGARVSDADPATGRLHVFGKGQRGRDVVVSRPLLEAALTLHHERCRDPHPRGTGCPHGRLLPRPNGAPLTVRHLEHWSDAAHERLPWATDKRLRAHPLRDTSAHQIEERCGHDSVAVSRFLGHSLTRRHGVTASYLRRGQWLPELTRIADASFGPLGDWPELAELPILLPYHTRIRRRAQ